MTLKRQHTKPKAQPVTDWIFIADKYAKDAVADKKGKYFGKRVRQAAQRYLDDKKKQGKRAFPYYLCPVESTKVCRFFELLPHVEGSWDSENIKLEPWQVFILVNLFGWRRLSDGFRRFDTAYIEVARKNGKSVFASGIALYCLCCEGELGPQVKCAATTGSQARIVFNVAKAMVQRVAALREAFRLEGFVNVITCFANGGNMVPINAKASTQDGLNPHCTIMDELHAHKSRELFDVLKSARGARRNPLSVYITTAGYNILGVCYEQHKFTAQIMDKIIVADHYFGIIFSIDELDDPLNEAVWRKANPGWDRMNQKEFRSYALEARHSTEAMFEFKTKRLNVWTTAKNGFINIIKWQQAKHAIDLNRLKDLPCWGAFDLAAVSDLNAFVLVWLDGDTVYVWARFYLPEDAIDPRTEKNGIPYRTWVEKGFIQTTPGNVTDYGYIQKDIEAALKEFKIKSIAYDPWQAQDMANRLMAEGAPMIEFRQGTSSYNAPMREVERLVLSLKLAHGNNPVLTWNASNVVARRDVNENIAPNKKESFEKIDGFVAMTMAVGIMMRNEGGMVEGESVYATRGIVEVSV